MRWRAVFRKGLVEQFRDYKATALTVLSPIVFILIFGLAFGQGFYTYTLAISNDDSGMLGQGLVREMESSRYPNGNKLFKVAAVDYNHEQLKEQVRKGIYEAHLYIPPGFSESLQKDAGTSPAAVSIMGNPSKLTYNFISSFVENYIHNFVWAHGIHGSPVQIQYDETSEAKVKSEFENMAPGLMIFSVFFLLILSSMAITKEVENRTIQRIVRSKVSAFEYCTGICLSQLVLAAIMLPLVFASAVLLGFSSSGSYLLAYLASLVATFSAIGIGLIIAAFCKTSLEAFIIGNVVVTPMMFLAGIFFKIPPVRLFSVMGKEIELLTFVPTLDAVSAMNKILLGNAGFTGILPEFIVLVLLSSGYFTLGVYLFGRRYMRRTGV